ncbi:MAG TPA: 6,7-dimethyl-8-ribityllumazine synthase [Thermoplasmata archaeon]|nr:6,7-dimethyl-8-ribityllumazine synthase [Thermoplasmata archaeon]
MRLAIVAATFNPEVTDAMVARAVARAKQLGVAVEVVRVPGTFEVPLALRRLLRRKDIDAGVAIGALIQGQTDHDDLLAHSVARALLDLQIRTGKPIGLGITGPGMSHAVAMRRIGNAARAVDAAVSMVRSRGPGKRTSQR